MYSLSDGGILSLRLPVLDEQSFSANNNNNNGGTYTTSSTYSTNIDKTRTVRLAGGLDVLGMFLDEFLIMAAMFRANQMIKMLDLMLEKSDSTM